jgi:hypothetical protein
VGGIVEQRDLQRARADELRERLVRGGDLRCRFVFGLVTADLRFSPQVVGHRRDRPVAQQRRACVVQVVPVGASGSNRAHRFDVNAGHEPDITVRG